MITGGLLTTRSLLSRIGYYLQASRQYRISYNKGYWPEPFTQQTLEQFLYDINYFEHPKNLINIGLDTGKRLPKDNETIENSNQSTNTKVGLSTNESDSVKTVDIEHLLDLLGEDVDLPSLDIDDTALNQTQLKNLAMSSGIYRDLFGKYNPTRDHISFTQEQARRMSIFVPPYWISDQPFARVKRHMKEPQELYYFEPLVTISARFVHKIQDHDAEYAHTSYHGNIIPASEALVKPTITLDGSRLIQKDTHKSEFARASNFKNWSPGKISCENFQDSAKDLYYTLLLLNLDSIHRDSALLHWMLPNIVPSRDKNLTHLEEGCDYLPVHGIRGFGYSRYVFLLLQHQSKLDLDIYKKMEMSPQSRRFSAKMFLDDNKNLGIKPVGLSWFQTTWDNSSNQVFHDYLKMQSPVYELVQDKLEKRDMANKAYPGKIPFNIFMDHYTDKKEINERVLLERLKTVDPFDYKDQYVPSKVPATAFVDENLPSWMNSVMFKKNNKIGYWRGLRPASAKIPLNNNADLDYPLKPMSKKFPPGYPNQYPAKPKIKLLRDLPYSKSADEHSSVFVQNDHEIVIDQVRREVEDLEAEKTKT